MFLSAASLKDALCCFAERAFHFRRSGLRACSITLFGSLLGAGTLFAALPISAQEAKGVDSAHPYACHVSSAFGALPFSDAVWVDYQDYYCFIHTTKPKDQDPGADNNGLLYTAEACTIMQLQNVSYDRNDIATGLPHWQVEGHPGLYRHAPENKMDPEGPDDYIGLGALAGVCGFHQVARDILNYGKPDDQALLLAGFNLNPVSQGKECYASLRKGITPTGFIPYNYNNVDPGKFTLATWLGKEPAIITHLKLGAGDRPTGSELAIWSAALLYSGESGLSDPPHSNQDRWLQSWLMVLTYEMAHYHSGDADAAVDKWWNLLYQRYPGGIQQTMTEYLNLPGGTEANPLSKYVKDFKDKRDTTAISVDAVEASLVDALQGLLSTKCGPGDTFGVCVQDNAASQTVFSKTFDSAFSSAQATVDSAKDLLESHQHLLDLAANVVNHSTDVVAGLTGRVADLQAQALQAQRNLAAMGAQKTDMLAKGLDKIRLPGHVEVHCLEKVFNKCVLFTPPIFIPGPMQANPALDNLTRAIGDLTNHFNDLQGSVLHAQHDLEDARRDLAKATTDRDTIKAELDRLNDALAKANKYRDAAKDALEGSQAVLQNLIPGVPLQCVP
jgi:hypothetical protein